MPYIVSISYCITWLEQRIMFLEFILLIILFRFLRKNLQATGLAPQWDRFLFGGMLVSIAFLVMDTTVHASRPVLFWVAQAMFFTLIYLAYYKKEFLPARPVIYAVLPLIAVSFISRLVRIIDSTFHEKWDNVFDTAIFFAIIWMVAMLIMNTRQRKALEKERLKTLEKEKEIKVTETLKAALEVQVTERTAALTLQKEELQRTLDELKSTQTQLIHSEKMASLGELTAGIAHEIQNPLNFVNNFSEVNKELLVEMKEEMDKGNLEDAKALANDIIDNEEKINHHGKRADAIVKGMLQHSRSSSGVKEPTDINALADEYLRLAYHGLRAKDKSFNATMKTDFDETIGNINIIPQDMGRVILNLITNAFYAVSMPSPEKIGTGAEAGFRDPDYKHSPTIWVSTKKTGNKIFITVKDNGPGIPKKILDKIFQPFFTTKPTGQGTGLGLSLSYDIVKAHGGELKVNTKEGEGSEFIILLPVV
ncbi:MAG: ATP-binding protein [Bacteroidota bacterium]